MKMKNKLYCHHKSKIGLVFRNLGLFSLSVLAVALIVTIPTYLSLKPDSGTPVLASEENEAEEPVEELPSVVEEE